MHSTIRLFIASIILLSLHLSSLARQVRVATFNVKSGVGAVGSPEYNAVRDILVRIDADVVAYQELRTSDEPNWNALALELGYGHQAIGEVTSLAGSIHVGYFSRFPITSTFNVFSPQSCAPPTIVNDITRPPLRAVIDVPDTETPLVLWNLHQKASGGIANEFRRAVEAIRVNDDIDNYLLTNPSHTEYIVLGDLNEDVAESQTTEIASLPSRLPASYQLGCDITFPIPYGLFPEDTYEIAGNGMHMLDAFQEDTADPGTLIASGRRVDYVFVSNDLWASDLGTPVAEVYNSDQDDGVGGLAVNGLSLTNGTSATASDHYAMFADIFMQDELVQSTTVIVSGVDASSVQVQFESLTNHQYTVEYYGGIAGSNSWTAVTDFVDVPGTGGVLVYSDDGTGTPSPPPNVNRRFYRITYRDL